MDANIRMNEKAMLKHLKGIYVNVYALTTFSYGQCLNSLKQRLSLKASRLISMWKYVKEHFCW